MLTRPLRSLRVSSDFLRQAAWLLFATLSFLPVPALAVTPVAPAAPQNDEIAVIESQAHCVDSAGISIGEVPDNEVKVACLQDAKVRFACNLDGQHARIEAFRQWETALMTFQEQCNQTGGTFAFATEGFKEPSNESFCSPAEPEVNYGELENPVCNFVSQCPRVQVICRRQDEPASLSSTHTALLPGIPKPVQIQN